ncbi:MAG: family transposase [Rhizobium sp.]|nr:family transposase [Rhizobium sp.]
MAQANGLKKSIAKSRRGWRQLHLALDADSGEIIAHALTDQVEPPLDRIDDEIGRFTADDGDLTCKAVLRHRTEARIIIAPRSTAVARQEAEPVEHRDCHVASIQADGPLKWQASTSYGKRALIETAMGRCKGIIGRRLLACGRPKSVR